MLSLVFSLLLSFALPNKFADTISVAQDGSGDFKTIQAAIEKAKTWDSTQTVTISIKSGTYREKIFIDRSRLILRGSKKPKLGAAVALLLVDRKAEGVKIIYSEAREIFRCDKPDDWGAATMNIRAQDVLLENLTIVNDFGFAAKGDSTFICKGAAKITRKDGHQFALRCMPPTQRLTVRNCNFHALGGDTVSPWDVDNGTFYFKNCTMEGGVDFYCPRGWAYAEGCYFICHNLNAAIWHDGTGNEAAKTVLKNCQFVGDKGYKLGRFHRDAQFYLINCTFSKDMADVDIYQVRKDTTLVWGKRTYYFNCHRTGGDFAWHANNLDKKTADQIGYDWTLKDRWHLPLQMMRHKSDYGLPPVASANVASASTEPVSTALTVKPETTISISDTIKTKTIGEGRINSPLHELADRMLLAERTTGGWSKFGIKGERIDYKNDWDAPTRAAVADSKGRNDATIDNNATTTEIRYLAKTFNEKQTPQYQAAAERGIAYLLKMQYPNGGFPQFYPDTSGYHKHITYNDDAMVKALQVLKDVAESRSPFEKIGENYRGEAKNAVERGVDIILKTQIISRGRLTIWCAQHDHKTLMPAKARAYELPSFSGKESVDIVEFLMGLDKPSPSVKLAISSAVAFLDSIKIVGITTKDIDDPAQPKGKDRVVVKDPTKTAWARFYDLDTHQAYFCGRDGVKKTNLSDIENERRTGYAFYVHDAADLLAQKYPKWLAKFGK